MRSLKIIAGLFFLVLFLAIVGMVSLATFVSPNRFKPLLVEQMKKYTGRELVLDGDLSWTFFPAIGLKVGHLLLYNTSDFKEKIFAEMDNATFSVKLLPLLQKRIESNGIILSGLKLNLIKNEKGKENWADLKKPQPTDAANQASVNTAPVAGSPKRTAFGIAVTGVDINNATIHWENQQTKQSFDVKKWNLHLNQISLGKPIPLKTSFEFVGSNPVVKGQVALNSDININLDEQTYSLNKIDLQSNVDQDSKHLKFKLQADATANLNNQTLNVDNLKGDLSNLKFSGKITTVSLNEKPITKGHLSIQPLDVKKWLKDTGIEVAALNQFSNLKGDFDFSAGTTLSSVDLKGNLQIDEIKASKISITNINAQTTLQKGILNVAPLTALFYQGNLTGSAKVNLNPALPDIALNMKLANVQAESLLADLASNDKLKVTGVGNIEAQVTTSGFDADTITKHLNGRAKLSFNDGVLKGLDIAYLFHNAISLAKKHETAGTNTSQTPFGSLTATAIIRDGVVTNDDLRMDTPQFDSTGNGKINLVAQTIHYQLQTKVKKTESDKNDLGNMYGLPIPIKISGDLTSPQITLDTTTLMKAVADQQLEKAKSQVKDRIAEKIKDKLPGNAGDVINNLFGNI